MFKRRLESAESSGLTSTIEDRRALTPNRRTPTPRSNITSKTEVTRVSRRKVRKYRLTNADMHFLELYTQHFPRPAHRVSPANRLKRRRLNKVNDAGAAGRAPRRGHTYELAEALCKVKERPMAAGIQGQMKLIGALRRLDQQRECAWKCWMHCAMRREAEHINNMRLPGK